MFHFSRLETTVEELDLGRKGEHILESTFTADFGKDSLDLATSLFYFFLFQMKLSRGLKLGKLAALFCGKECKGYSAGDLKVKVFGFWF